MQNIIRFHVPCDKEYQKMVGEFALILGGQMGRSADDLLVKEIKQVMTDVFNNIVNYSNTAAQNEVVRFQFELGNHFFLISIYDYGPGFKAEQFLPPYPKDYIGETYNLCAVESGSVLFKVIDPLSISFSLQTDKKAAGVAKKSAASAADRCGNLARITKMMDSVTYSYIGQGKYDWKLIKNLK